MTEANYTKPPFFTHSTPKDVADALGYLVALKPCCGGEEDCCGPWDEVTAALQAGIMTGIRLAAERIAERIRYELVCCSSEDIDEMASFLHRAGPMAPGKHFHDICYWADMSARLAEDPHSQLEMPYECHGLHPGPCPGIKRCRQEGHLFCSLCHMCENCDGKCKCADPDHRVDGGEDDVPGLPA